MSNFDEKFGPAPVSVVDEARLLGVQFVCMFLIAYSIQPSFLHAPNTSRTSVSLTVLFAILVVLATITVHRSFKRAE